MCLYSAGDIPQRQAQVGDRLVVGQVHSDICGLFERGGRRLLVCLPKGSTLELRIPWKTCWGLGLPKTVTVITDERTSFGHLGVDVIRLESDPGRPLTFAGLRNTRARVLALGVPRPRIIEDPMPEAISPGGEIEEVPVEEALMALPPDHPDVIGRREPVLAGER